HDQPKRLQPVHFGNAARRSLSWDCNLPSALSCAARAAACSFGSGFGVALAETFFSFGAPRGNFLVWPLFSQLCIRSLRSADCAARFFNRVRAVATASSLRRRN